MDGFHWLEVPWEAVGLHPSLNPDLVWVLTISLYLGMLKEEGQTTSRGRSDVWEPKGRESYTEWCPQAIATS